MAYTFRGGTHVAEHKNTQRRQIEKMPPPARVSIPLSQHIGTHCQPLVKVGDYVFRGQVIGDVEKGLGCPVHASVSGTVVALDTRNNAAAQPIVNIVIENDGEMALDPSIQPHDKKLSQTTTEEIIDIVRRAGISGMGGATFPTYAKIQSALGKVERLIVNCAECEPYITANHRLLLENPAAVINGTKILLKALGLRQADIAIEDNKLDAINKIEAMVAGSSLIKVRVLKTKYPQGEKSMIIYSLTRKEPTHGVRLADIGYVIFNVESCASIYRACRYGTALTERIVTIDGDCISKPQNVIARIGTPIRDIIDFCGGLKCQPKKVINGGPMMGAAQWNMDGVVTKGTSALLFFSEKAENRDNLPPVCIRCGRCVKNCPMHLMPNYLVKLAQSKKYTECEQYHISDCMECGTCSYNCPGHMEIVQYIRVAKGALRARR